MEKLLQELIASSGIQDALLRIGPKIMTHYGPKLGEMANELIRQYLQWWPF